jgi:hypothetical protein
MVENYYDVLSFLEDYDIPFQLSGKNVTSGWAEIQCPYENCSDPSKHCGINLQSNLHNCWICGGKGGMEKLVSKILSIPYYSAQNILSKYSATPKFMGVESTNSRDLSKDISLEAFDIKLPNLHQNYLKTRGFDPGGIQRKYKILSCYQSGDFSYRIIIPIFIEGVAVNFTARDVTSQQSPKYKNLSNEKALIPMKECLYNIDSVFDTVVICEGVTDVWRIGDGSVATMGVEFTSKQLELLSRKRLRNAFVLYDSDAILKAEKLANALSIFIPHTEIVILENGDPGDMKPEEANHLRKELGL